MRAPGRAWSVFRAPTFTASWPPSNRQNPRRPREIGPQQRDERIHGVQPLSPGRQPPWAPILLRSHGKHNALRYLGTIFRPRGVTWPTGSGFSCENGRRLTKPRLTLWLDSRLSKTSFLISNPHQDSSHHASPHTYCTTTRR